VSAHSKVQRGGTGNSMRRTRFVGLDLGDRHWHVAVLDEEGALIEEARLPTTQAAFRRKFTGMPACRIAMEVGSPSRWVSLLLRDLGHEARVANARKLRAINHNPRKGYRVDAQTPWHVSIQHCFHLFTPALRSPWHIWPSAHQGRPRPFPHSADQPRPGNRQGCWCPFSLVHRAWFRRQGDPCHPRPAPSSLVA